MKYTAYNKMYRAYRGKGQKGILLRVLVGAAILFLLVLGIASLLFWRELAISGAVQRLGSERPAYQMEVKGGYHFEEFLKQGGASSDGEVSAFLSKKIAKGLYTVPVGTYREGGSVLSAQTEDGALLWGRNYDGTDSVPVIVRHIPKEGYVSLATCDFQNITGSAETLPEGFLNKMLAIAALYVPLDGVNEAGLCVADLEINEGGMPDPDTEKPDLTVTTAIRLLLDRAATVEEAVALLRQYDIHPSGGISHHLAISDASGASVVVEFTEEGNEGLVAIPAEAVTNFNLSSGDRSAGGEDAQKRWQILHDLYREHEGVLTRTQMLDALAEVSQTGGEWPAQWTMIYSQAEPFVTWYFDGSAAEGVSLSLLPSP